MVGTKRASLEEVVHARGDLASLVRTGIYLIATDPREFDRFIRALTVTHPDLASHVAWTLSGVRGVKIEKVAER